MNLPFADSTQSTLGIEWEVALVDAATGDLRSEAPAILHELHEEAGLAEGEDHPHVTGELLQNTVELVTGVHEAVPAAVAELGTIAARVARAAADAAVEDHGALGVR